VESLHVFRKKRGPIAANSCPLTEGENEKEEVERKKCYMGPCRLLKKTKKMNCFI